jgi:hypothetical protein
MKAAKYVLIFLIAIQFLLPYAVPMRALYSYRLDYPMFLNNINNYYALLDKIKQEIDRKKLKNYIILIGDSVGYGFPVNSWQSLSYHMQDIATKEKGKDAPVVFNLSMASVMSGDAYTLLLLMDKYGISTDHVVMNVRYASFADRSAGPRVVFWLGDALKAVDKQSYERALPQLKASGFKVETAWDKKLHHYMETQVYPKIALFRYKDAIVKEIKLSFNETFRGIPRPVNDNQGDMSNWNKKEELKKAIANKDPYFLSSMDPKPFDMSENNLQIYFMNKIIEHQKGKQTVIALTGTNPELMKESVNDPGYIANLHRIDEYFADKPVTYMNLQHAIGQEYYTDHTHYTTEGYRILAGILWDKLKLTEGK